MWKVLETADTIKIFLLRCYLWTILHPILGVICESYGQFFGKTPCPFWQSNTVYSNKTIIALTSKSKLKSGFSGDFSNPSYKII